jgi:hypothetical protein
MRMTYAGLALVLLCAMWSCSEDGDGSEFEDGSGGTSGAAGSAGNGPGGTAGSAGSLGVGGTLPFQDGGRPDGGGGTGARPNTPVEVIITADNAYGFGYGTRTALLNYFGGIENPGTDDIFACPVGRGPERYTVPAGDANAGNFLYIIGYADKLTTQGVIAKFSRAGAPAVFTGLGAWQACATGEDFGVGDGGPDRAKIDSYLVKCNAGNLPAGTSSKGWVGTTQTPNGSVAFGEDNSTERDAVTPENPFKIACEIDASARWMWYDWDPNTNQSPFIWPDGNDTNLAREFIIFRLGAEFIPEPPQ